MSQEVPVSVTSKNRRDEEQVTGKAGTEPPQGQKEGQCARGGAGEPLGRPADMGRRRQRTQRRARTAFLG